MEDQLEDIQQFINQKVIQALLSNKDDEMVNFKISSNDGASSSIFSFGSHNEILKNIST